MNTEKKSNRETLDFNDGSLNKISDLKSNLRSYISGLSYCNDKDHKLVACRKDYKNELSTLPRFSSWSDVFSKEENILRNFLTFIYLGGILDTIKEIKEIIPTYQPSSDEVTKAIDQAKRFIPEARKMLDEAEQTLNDVCLD